VLLLLLAAQHPLNGTMCRVDTYTTLVQPISSVPGKLRVTEKMQHCLTSHEVVLSDFVADLGANTTGAC